MLVYTSAFAKLLPFCTALWDPIDRSQEIFLGVDPTSDYLLHWQASIATNATWRLNAGWVLIQYDRWPCKKGNLEGTDTRGEWHVKMKSRDQGDASISQGKSRIALKPPGVRWETWSILLSLSPALRSNQPCNTWSQTFSSGAVR